MARTALAFLCTIFKFSVWVQLYQAYEDLKASGMHHLFTTLEFYPHLNAETPNLTIGPHLK